MSVCLAWHNKVDDATLTSSATYESTLPLANLKDYLLHTVARTTAADPFTITASFAAKIICGCVFIANHNLGRLSTLQIKCYDGVTLKDDSGVMVVYPQSSNAVVSADEIATLRHDFSYFLPVNQSIDKVEITFTPTNSSYVQLARLFIGEVYEPVNGVDYGDQPYGYKSMSEVDTLPCGTRYAYIRDPLRYVDLSLKYLSTFESVNNIFDAHRRISPIGEIIYSHTGRPTLSAVNEGLAQNKEFFARCFIANFVELNPLNSIFYEGHTTTLRLLEVAI